MVMNQHQTNIYPTGAETDAQRPPEYLASHARDLIALMGGVKRNVDKNMPKQN